MYNLDDPVIILRGIGENAQKMLNKKGIFTLRDMLYYLPVSFKDFNHIQLIKDAKPGDNYLFKITADTDISGSLIRKNLSIFNFVGNDDSGSVKITFFNQGYLKKKIKKGSEVYIYGAVKRDSRGNIYLTAREFYFSRPKNGYLPLYSLSKGITQNIYRKYIKEILDNSEIDKIYREEFVKKFNLMPLNETLLSLHFPKNKHDFFNARSRIVFDELLMFFRMLDFLNSKKTQKSDKILKNTAELLIEFKQKLPFNLTDSQISVINEISGDFESKSFMNRLIQGDVGSGKTVISFYAMYCMNGAGYQSALMAPTEVLAEQHYDNAVRILGADKTVLLTGSTTAKNKKKIIEKIESGEAKYIIGTHALLYGDIKFKNLGLLVTDEQHRFGVKQRAALAKRSMEKLHLLNMTATPIPRSLALAIYGKTDISTIDELPPGRIPIKTYLIHENKRNAMFGFINDEIENGRQAYFVCPLIEDLNYSGGDTQSVVDMYDELKRNFPGRSTALLHGKMKPKEKNKIMEDFKSGVIDILVSTTVIEVGVDVPNASVMAIQNAERFGMAQLHQLRGRVGRGSEQSYCFLISDNDGALNRLRFLTQTNDGFEIAKKDMKLRGTGEFWGFKQHGDPALKNADLFKDYKEVLKARQALETIKNDKTFFDEYDWVNKTALKRIKKLNEEVIMN